MGMRWTELHLLLSLPGIFYRPPGRTQPGSTDEDYGLQASIQLQGCFLADNKNYTCFPSFQVHPDRFIEISSKFKLYNMIIFIQVSVGKPFPE